MMEKTFKEFSKDYGRYYGLKTGEYFRIETEDDMQEVIYDLYDTEDFEVDYENKVIFIY